MVSNDFLNEHLVEPGEFNTIYGGVASPTQPPEALLLKPSIDRSSLTNPEQTWSSSLQVVLDQPPASLPKRLLLGGAIFSLAFAAWANFGQIDEIGHARGQLVPKGEVYKIHPSETGKVIKLVVKEGDRVKAGQLLVELDPQMAAGEVERLEEILEADKVQLLQTQSLMDRTLGEVETAKAIAAAEVRSQEVEIARAQGTVATVRSLIQGMQADTAAQQARWQKLKPLGDRAQELLRQLQVDVAAQQARRQQMESLPNRSQELLMQLQANVKVHQERVQRLQPLVEAGALSKELLFQAEQALRDSQSLVVRTQLAEVTQAKERLFEVEQTMRDRQNAMVRAQLSEVAQVQERLFEVEQALRDRSASLIKTQGELAERLQEVESLQTQLAQKQATARQVQLEKEQKIQQLQVEMTQLRAKVTEAKNLLVAAKTKLQQRFLYAPIDGVVSSLNLHNVGEVVQPGQTLAEMAPESVPLILAVSLPNREAGFVKTGMAVQLKFDAYPYQNYGVVTGKVSSISPDAKADEHLGSVYHLEVALERDSVMANHQAIQLKAGQTANAEIVIRRRRVVDVLLDPLKQLQKGGMSL